MMNHKIKSLGYLVWIGIGILFISLIIYPDFSSLSTIIQLAALIITVIYFVSIGIFARTVIRDYYIGFYEMRVSLLFHPAAIIVIPLMLLSVYLMYG